MQNRLGSKAIENFEQSVGNFFSRFLAKVTHYVDSCSGESDYDLHHQSITGKRKWRYFLSFCCESLGLSFNLCYTCNNPAQSPQLFSSTFAKRFQIEYRFNPQSHAIESRSIGAVSGFVRVSGSDLRLFII